MRSASALSVEIILLASVVGLAGRWLLGRAERFSRAAACLRRASGNHHVQAGLLVLLGFGALLAWPALQLADPMPGWPTEEANAEGEPSRKQPAPVVALTDRGGSITLYPTTLREPLSCSLESEGRFLRKAGLELRLIRTGLPTPESNCHGWVFTGGRFSLGGEVVERVLDDDGYAEVGTPQAGDLVVYRCGGGHVLHTGVVKGVGAEGLVLVESKFSMHGRFLHRPEDQPYSRHWQFYRSPRDGHLLHNLPDDPDAPPASLVRGQPAV